MEIHSQPFCGLTQKSSEKEKEIPLKEVLMDVVVADKLQHLLLFVLLLFGKNNISSNNLK